MSGAGRRFSPRPGYTRRSSPSSVCGVSPTSPRFTGSGAWRRRTPSYGSPPASSWARRWWDGCRTASSACRGSLSLSARGSTPRAGSSSSSRGDLRASATLLGPLFFIMGLTASSLILVWSCVREVNNPAHVGIVIGFCNAPIFLAFAMLQWLTGAILDATWAGLEAGGVRIYPEAGYRTAFGVCLAVAAGSLVMAPLVTETRLRHIWGRATHPGG